jgi:hypothetical protein
LRQVLDALVVLEGQVEMAVVVPWNAAYGPGAATVIGPREKLVVIRPIADEPSDSIMLFYLNLVSTRLGLSPAQLSSEFRQVLVRCMFWSGGIPRTYLQLLADAGSYARLLRGEDWAQVQDIERAVADQRDSFRRLMLPGDAAALLAVDGTDGRELDLRTKLRLLAHGMLIEQTQNGNPVLRPHPMMRKLIALGSAVA